MTHASPATLQTSFAFLAAEPALEKLGMKFSAGGPHISRTMMLAELGAVLASVPPGSTAADYREAILQRNVLGKTTDSTRQKSLRHLRELYALDEATPIFAVLRKLFGMDAGTLPLLAVQVAWARDPLLRATTPPVMDASEGERVETVSLAARRANEDLGIMFFAPKKPDLQGIRSGRGELSCGRSRRHIKH